MVDKTKNILNTMKAFSNVSQIPVTLLDENGEPAWNLHAGEKILQHLRFL